MTSETGNGNRVYVKVGDVIRLLMPRSEMCVRCGIAETPVYVSMATLLRNDGSAFPGPIPVGEAGIHLDEAGLRPLPPQRLS